MTERKRLLQSCRGLELFSDLPGELDPQDLKVVADKQRDIGLSCRIAMPLANGTVNETEKAHPLACRHQLSRDLIGKRSAKRPACDSIGSSSLHGTNFLEICVRKALGAHL